MRLVCIICGADPSTQAIAVYRVNNKGQSGRFACRADFDEARALFPDDNPDAPAPAKSDDDASMKELGFWTGGTHWP